MIVDSLSNATSIEQLHPLFKKAFDFLRSTDFSKIESGKIELEGDQLFVSIVETQGKSKENAKIETHQKYIDIQMPIEGIETMGWLAEKSCKSESAPYNPDKDITFYDDKPSMYLTLNPYEFAIFFPEDGHAPAIADGKIKKAIVKVAI